MLHKDKIYKKRLHINYLIAKETIDFINPKQKMMQNPEGQQCRLDSCQKQIIESTKYNLSKAKSFSKHAILNKHLKYPKRQNEHSRVIYKQVSSLCNLFESNLEQQKQRTPTKSRAKSKLNGLLCNSFDQNNKQKPCSQNKFKQIKLISDLPQYPKRYSSLNQSSNALTLRNAINKQRAATFRPEQSLSPNQQCLGSKIKMQCALLNYGENPMTIQQSSGKSLTKVTSILKLKPKNNKQGEKAIKLTAMNKYDFGYENIRLASKILSIKPTKWCDLKQQKKFYKQQSYFKEIRSRTIQMNDQSHLNSISQTISFPKINERYRTTVQ